MEPILNDTLSLAFKGAAQGVTKMVDYSLGQNDVKVVIGVLAAVAIFMFFLSKR